MAENVNSTWAEQSVAPATPATNKWKIYPKSDGFYIMTDDGVEHKLTLPTDTGAFAPVGAKYLVQTADGDLSAEQAMGALATGIVKNTTTTGVLSIAVAETDYVTPTGAGALTNKTLDGDLNTVQDLPLTAIKTVGANTKRFLTRDASGVPTDAANPPLDNLQHTHADAANGGTLGAAAIASGTLDAARIPFASPSAIGSGTPAAATITTLIASMFKLTTSTVLTIATGAVTATQSFHRIDTEASAASDDLDTISGGAAGFRLVLRAENTARTVVITTAGNIQTFGAASITLDETYKFVELIYDGDLSKWVQIGGTGSGGAVDASAVTYTPSDTSKWSGSTDPGNQNDANDQLASRVTVNESDIAGLTAGGISSAGWVALGQTLTYASADDPTYTCTCAGVDLTSTLSVGMKLRISQSTGGTKYFFVTAIAFSTNTTITLYGGTNYDLNNETISTPYFSVVKAPFAFPLDPTKWTAEVTDVTQRSQATPTANVWYNLGGVNIVVPIGVWRVSYDVSVRTNDAQSLGWTVYTTLSTANNSESDVDFTIWTRVGNAFSVVGQLHRNKVLALTVKTTYYLNSKNGDAGLDAIYHENGVSRCFLRAVCSYL